jgi:hypothetical protein
MGSRPWVQVVGTGHRRRATSATHRVERKPRPGAGHGRSREPQHRRLSPQGPRPPAIPRRPGRRPAVARWVTRLGRLLPYRDCPCQTAFGASGSNARHGAGRTHRPDPVPLHKKVTARAGQRYARGGRAAARQSPEHGPEHRDLRGSTMAYRQRPSIDPDAVLPKPVHRTLPLIGRCQTAINVTKPCECERMYRLTVHS